MFIVSPYSHPPGTMLSAIQRVGLTTNLKLCLDASDIDSYAGSGQVWSDVSGNSYNFYRGSSGGGSDAADPTFNGTAGRQSSSENWSFDGGDYFTYNTFNETWMESLHKNSAIFSCAFWVYVNTIASVNGIFGTNATSSANIGCSSNIRTDGTLRLHAASGNVGTPALLADSTATVTTGAWNFLAISVDEAATTVRHQINGTQESASASYSSPSASSATYTMELGSTGNAGAGAGAIMQSGGRMASAAFWQGSTISATDMLALFNATRSKFGV